MSKATACVYNPLTVHVEPLGVHTTGDALQVPYPDPGVCLAKGIEFPRVVVTGEGNWY